MKRRIAILATEFIKPQIEKCLDKLRLDCDYNIFCYHPFEEEFVQAYRAIPSSVDGILTCSTLFAQVIQASFPSDERVVCAFDIDDAALFRLYVKLLDAGKLPDLSRIYSDFLENLHVDLHEFLTMEHEIPLSDTLGMQGEDRSAAALQRLEEEQYQKLLEIWNSGTVDFMITRFSELVPLLREKDVTIYYPYPNLDSIKRACIQLLHDIDLRQMQDNLPAAIHINIWTSDPSNITQTAFEQRCSALQDALNTFIGNALDHVVRRQHFGVEILTSKKTVMRYTDGFSSCQLSEYLASHLDFKTYIGYGIGHDIYQARLNAINAVREADVTGKSHIITEDETLIGPLGDTRVRSVPIAPPVTHRSITRTGLSSLTISKVLTILDSMPNRRITAQELAMKLSVTRRGANYFLKAMTNTGILRVVSERRTTTRGRPEQVYERSPEEPAKEESSP